MNTRLASSLSHYFTARWHRGPKVHIAPTARDLPVPAPEDARGLYWRGDVHLVAAQPMDSFAQALVHEAVGHHGLRQLMGSEWKHFMRHISDGIRAGEPGLQHIRRHIRRSYTDDAGRYMLTSRQEADEVAAYVAEEMVCYATGSIKPDRPLTQALQAVKGRVLREGLCLDRNVSRSELEGALFLAAKHLEGWPWLPVRHRIRRFWGTCANMLGMVDKYKPPMSMAESERLLRNEAQRIKDKEERAFLFNGIFGILCLIGLVVCAVLVLLGFGKIFFGH
ncbi:hypothetical protein [Comamonas odontotermitis]|uniref:hypothetical protein n=1 Tax=Comamonas odontotermitis TaxID=379895 RepID=UPI001CC3C955|nr:hypothetical protein [Comamonas odontotermitis]UBB15424.1 hypothetical protein LAD35_11115 [Comamonas odontotermitis]